VIGNVDILPTSSNPLTIKQWDFLYFFLNNFNAGLEPIRIYIIPIEGTTILKCKTFYLSSYFNWKNRFVRSFLRAYVNQNSVFNVIRTQDFNDWRPKSLVYLLGQEKMTILECFNQEIYNIISKNIKHNQFDNFKMLYGAQSI